MAAAGEPVRERPALVTEQCTFLVGRPETPDLAATLWDLPGWAARARELESALDEAADLPSTFILAAAVLRHFLADPLLPAELLPGDWPGAACAPATRSSTSSSFKRR